MSILDWLLRPPESGVPTEALVAIASVAVVIWTGGFIVRGWMKTTGLVAGMSYLQFAFFGSILGLLASAAVLRCAAVAFFVYYLVFFQEHSALLRGRDSDERVIVPLFHAARITGPRFWLGLQLIELIPLVIVFVWPQPRVVAWSCVAMTFLGYQIMLTFVYSDVVRTRGEPRGESEPTLDDG